MKPYGIPRVPEAGAYPDLADINRFGFKSSRSRIKRHGHIKNSFHRPSSKASSRRIWKKLARRDGKKIAQAEFNELQLGADEGVTDEDWNSFLC